MLASLTIRGPGCSCQACQSSLVLSKCRSLAEKRVVVGSNPAGRASFTQKGPHIGAGLFCFSDRESV